MNIILKILHSIVSYILVGIAGIIFGLPIFIILLLPERMRYNSRFFAQCEYYFFYWSLKAVLVPINYTGWQNIPHDQPVIFAANHQSALDIPLLGLLARGHQNVWLAWTNLTRYPVLGFVLRRIAVLVDATSPQRATRTLLQAINRIKDNHHHVMIFPEGSRFIDGKVHDFFSGFVMLARRTGRCVVPVFIKDARKVYAPDAWLITWYPIKVIIGPLFKCNETESDEEFKHRVHNWFVEQQEK